MLAVHELRCTTDDQSVGIAVDEHRSDPADAGTESHVDQEDAGLRAVRGEHLCAVDDETIPARRRRRRQIGDGRTCLGLGHAQTDQGLSGQQAGQVALPLLRRRVFGERANGAEVTGLDDVGAAGTTGGDRLDRGDGGQQGAALSTLLLRDGQPEQPHRRHLLGDVPRVVGGVRADERTRRQSLSGEGFDRVAKLVEFPGKAEVHGCSLSGVNGGVRQGIPLVVTHWRGSARTPAGRGRE